MRCGTPRSPRYKGFVRASTGGSAPARVQATYTSGNRWTRARRQSAAATSTTASSRPYGDPTLNKGLSDFDIRHNFAFNATWELPFGGAPRVTRSVGRRLAAVRHLSRPVPASRQPGPRLRSCARDSPRSGGAGTVAGPFVGLFVESRLGGANQYLRMLNCFALPGGRHAWQPPRNPSSARGSATSTRAFQEHPGHRP